MISFFAYQAYRYVWEHEKSRFGEDKRDYELHITPNLRYKEDLEDGRQTTDDRFYSGKAFIKINAKELVLRRNIFKVARVFQCLHWN